MLNSTMVRGAVFLLALAPVAACAQPAGQATSGRTKAPRSMTLQQFTARHESKILAADTDGDGKVSKAEFIASAKAGKGDPAKRFAKIDRNGDGMLDKTEIDAMLARRFRRVDTDGDGVASAAERAAAHARKGEASGNGADS
jgi:EF hand